MAVSLTNGNYFITHTRTGAIVKVNNIGEAQDFRTVERAMEHKRKHPGKTSGYYYIGTEDNVHTKSAAQVENTFKRKHFSPSDRLQIYRKTRGHCYMCGEFIDYDKFEIEHRIPLAKGGTNDMNNLFCSCHTCNNLKGSIAPADLMEKIKQIHLYQIRKVHGNSIKWKIAYKALEGIL